MITVNLKHPVQSEGVEISKIDFREPIGEDVVVCGYPFRIYIGSGTDVDSANSGEQEMKIDTLVLANLASRLGSVPKSTIKKLSVQDFQQVVDVVSNFF